MSALFCHGIQSLEFKQSPTPFVVILLCLQRKIHQCLAAKVEGCSTTASLSQVTKEIYLICIAGWCLEVFFVHQLGDVFAAKFCLKTWEFYNKPQNREGWMERGMVVRELFVALNGYSLRALWEQFCSFIQSSQGGLRSSSSIKGFSEINGWLAWRVTTIRIRPHIDFVMNRTLSWECKQPRRWFEQMSSTMAQQQENILHLSKYIFAQFMSWECSVWRKINLLWGQWSAL